MTSTEQRQVQQGSAAEWVGEAAHRTEHRSARRPWWLAFPATFGLVALNVAVFLWMSQYGPLPTVFRDHAWGSLLTAPFDFFTLLRFGASNGILILHGQWWRLLTAAFIHVTVLHLLLNMWCLWNLGLLGEPLLGKPGLVSVYLLTGIAGNLLSMAWGVFTRMDSVVAGASGAVFGIAGILIVLLSNRGLAKKGLRWEEIRHLRSQVILFAAANLIIGMAPNFVPAFNPATLAHLHLSPNAFPHVANTAHLGGFLSGLLLGLPLFPKMIVSKEAYRARQRITFAGAMLALCLFAYAIASFAGRA